MNSSRLNTDESGVAHYLLVGLLLVVVVAAGAFVFLKVHSAANKPATTGASSVSQTVNPDDQEASDNTALDNADKGAQQASDQSNTQGSDDVAQ
jgi:hypothetical protein